MNDNARTYAILNITFDYKLYNFFDKYKEKIAYKENVPIYNLYNGDSLTIIERCNDFFYVNESEYQNGKNFDPSNYNVKNMSEMFKKFYYFIKNNYNNLIQYDYILRCNSSTFLNHRKIKNIINNLPQTNCYAGKIVDSEPYMVSGTAMILSRDVIKLFYETNIDDIEINGIWDDVAIGRFLSIKNKIKPIPLSQYSFISGKIPGDEIVKISLNYPTVRVRNNNDREKIDCETWKKLFHYYENQ